MKGRIALVAQLAAALCLAAFAGTALADNGKNPPGAPPGNSGNAPGQEKKAEQQAPAPPPAAPQPAPPQPAAPAASEQGASAGHGKPDKADKPAKPEKPAKPQSSTRPEKPARPAAQQPATVGTAQSSGNGRSDEAHHHVIVCHRTGSDSNPYVVINIPLTAWHGGHTSHPILNGRSDILLKNPASRPGSKDGFSKEDCEAAAGVTPEAAKPVTSTTTTSSSATGTTSSSTTTTTSSSTSSSAAAAAAASAASGPAAGGPAAAGSERSGGVAGAVASAVRKAGKPFGGVLGAGGQLGKVAVRGTLPFTGLPLWGVALVAAALIALGFVLRRRWARPTAL